DRVAEAVRARARHSIAASAIAAWRRCAESVSPINTARKAESAASKSWLMNAACACSNGGRGRDDSESGCCAVARERSRKPASPTKRPPVRALAQSQCATDFLLLKEK